VGPLGRFSRLNVGKWPVVRPEREGGGWRKLRDTTRAGAIPLEEGGREERNGSPQG